jgi:HSP20 family protein
MLPTVQNDPLSLMNQWRRDLERAFSGGWGEGAASNGVTAAAWMPAVDIKEEHDAYVVRADLPGVDPKDIELHMENSVLTLRGERRSENIQKQDNYQRLERVTGTFYRRFTLPDTADAEHISAKTANGVLEVRIPSSEKALPRRIEVQA